MPIHIRILEPMDESRVSSWVPESGRKKYIVLRLAWGLQIRVRWVRRIIEPFQNMWIRETVEDGIKSLAVPVTVGDKMF